MSKILSFFTLLLLCTQLMAQNRSITGKVMDEKGEPIPLASVSLKGEKVGVSTSADGSFQINVPSRTKKLVISSIGFLPQEITVGDLTNMVVTLKINPNEISEVVVTGYTKVKKSEYSGAATIVPKEQINDIPMGSFDQILQGRAPGLLVTVGSGQPGSAARVQIRGQGSISGGNDPLYIVDGMPVEAEDFSALNAADFETIQVLKDAVATSQYGNRGSSGVIVVTTKKGRPGRTVLNYTGQGGITQPGKQRFGMANTDQLLQIQQAVGLQEPGVTVPGWAYSPLNPNNAGLPPDQVAANAHYLDSLHGINTNWKNVFERQGSFQQHQLSLSGGTENTRFYIAGNYYKEQGIGLNSALTRYSFRANLDHKTDRLNLNLTTGVGYASSNYISSENGLYLANEFAAAYLALPYQKLRNPDGSVAVGVGNIGANAYEVQTHDNSITSGELKANLGLNVTYDITKNIYIGGYTGLDYRQTTNTSTVYPGTYFATSYSFPTGPDVGDSVGHGNYSIGSDMHLEYITRALAGFKKKFDGKHDLDVQFVSEYTKDHNFSYGYTGYGINSHLLNTPAGVTPGTIDNKLIASTTGAKSERALYALMLLGKYTYLDKYTVNVTLRRDATSQLAADERWQNFYSAGATWDVLKEDFASDWSNNINSLRFRLSYGQSANADGFIFGYYGYLPTYGTGTYAGNPTTLPNNAGNTSVTWERIKTWNAGIDFGFFQDRLTGSLDVYRKLTDGNVIPFQLSYTSGFESLPVNAGVVVNKGIELGLNADVIRTKDFKWSVGGNISYNHNRVTKLAQVSQFEQGTELVKVGLPLGSHYIVKWAGVDAATGQPLYYDSTGKVTNLYSANNSVAQFGTYNAPWIGGFSTGVYYKGLSLDAFFSFQEGFSIFNNQDYFGLDPNSVLDGFNVRSDAAKMWQKPGDVTNIQSPKYQRQFSSKDIQDASYIRFRNLTLAYNFDKKILNRTKVLSGVRIFVQAQNLYTWTKWTGFDPEYANNIATYAYPVPRTYTGGVTLSF